MIIFFVCHATHYHHQSMQISYSFYLTLILLSCHTITLISITMNLAQYRTDHHTIQPYQSHDKVALAFNEPIV
jgi:hypothetical protein